MVVLGGAPLHTQESLRARYGLRAEFIFVPQFLNPAQGRNIGLRAAKTRLAVLIDNDVHVRPGWFEPLLECRHETGATMVVPLMLELDNWIHTAGNDLYITYENNRAYAYKTLRHHHKKYCEGSNLKREPTDYGELHCQLVEVEPALRLAVYDEQIQEVGECDSGLIWKKAGLPMWFEPKSVVDYAQPTGITDSDDLRFFIWRWDMRLILKGYLHFQKKWNIDMTEYHTFQEWLLRWNRKLGFLPRVFPSKWALLVDLRIKKLFELIAKVIQLPQSLWNRLVAWRLGFYDWPQKN